MAYNTQCSDAGPDEAMRLAVEKFRTKMESSNRQFLQDRIDEIEAMGLATEEQKFKKIRFYWNKIGLKGQGRLNDGAPPEPVRQDLEARNITRLQDVAGIYHQYMDGIESPTLVTDEWRQMYLEVMEIVCNKAAQDQEQDEELQDKEHETFHIPICHELGYFLKYANGVCDPDFRCSGICGFYVGFGVGVFKYAFPDRLPSTFIPPNISASREILKSYLQDFILDGDSLEGLIDSDLEVKVGFRTGIGNRFEYDEWYSAYLYCRQDDDSNEPDPNLRDWAWRVVVFHADGENPTTLYGRYPRFNTIPEFLDWYSSWPDYVDMDVIRKDVRHDYEGPD